MLTCRVPTPPEAARLLAALIAALVCLAAGGATAAVAGPIVAPAPGKAFDAGPVRVAVRAGTDVKVRLNGERIAPHQLGRVRRGVRSVTVSPSHGLKHGLNVLHVRVRDAKGKWRRATRRFRVRGTAPLAAAGETRYVALGSKVFLDGGESLLQPRARGTRLRYRWRVLSRPKSGRAGAAATPLLSGASSAAATLTPDRAGTHELELTVTAPNGESGTDVVEVRADPIPSVRVETMATRGDRSGVAITGPTDATTRFYPGTRDKWLHVVVLRRGDLSLVSNTDYDCPQAAQPIGPDQTAAVSDCIDRVKADMAKLDDTDLVIAESLPQATPDAQRPVGVSVALGPRLGVRAWNWWKGDVAPASGTFSAFGVPGVPALAVQSAAIDQTAPDPHPILGNLVRDNEGNYGFDPGERRPFDTQAAGSDATTNVVALGDRVFAQPTLGQNGFHVVVVDPRTLDGRSAFFETNGPPADFVLSELGEMRDMLHAANTSAGDGFGVHPLVFVASRGNPAPAGAGAELSEALKEVADQLETMGGTRGRFFAAMDRTIRSGNSYTLVSSAPAGAGAASETLGPAQPGGAANTAAQRGMVARTGFYFEFQVQNEERVEGAEHGVAQLLQTAGAAPSAWPEQGNPGRTAAIEFIGEKVLGTDDPRSQFWTLPYDADTWDGTIKPAIGALTYPGVAAFTADDLTWAKQELTDEIGWLGSTHAYLAALAQPFARTELQSWADLQSVAADVETQVQPVDTTVNGSAEMAIELGFELGEEVIPLKPARKAMAIAGALYHFGLDLAKVEGEPAEESFSVPVAETGKELAARLSSAQTFLMRQLPNVIAADYRRLQIVGSCASPLATVGAACPFDRAEWQYTQDDQAAAARVIRQASEVTAYGMLIPARYTAWLLPPSRYTAANDRFGGIVGIATCVKPFADAPASAQYAKGIYRDVPDHKADVYEITALGFRTGSGTLKDRWVMHLPQKSLTDHVFGSGQGDLGVNPEDFFSRFLSRTTALGGYPEDTTEMGWDFRECGASAVAGKPPAAPAVVPLRRAMRHGVPVAYDVPGARSTVRVTLSSPTGRVLAATTLRRQGIGRHRIALTVGGSAARRLRAAGGHRAVLRVRVESPGRKPVVHRQPVRLTY